MTDTTGTTGTTDTTDTADPTTPAVTSSRRPQVPSSSFDFTAGAFERARNTRLLNIVLASVFAVAVLALAGLGLRDSVLASGADDRLTKSTQELGEARIQLNQAIAGATGSSPSSSLTSDGMRERIAQRAAGLQHLGSRDVDVTALINSASGAAAAADATLTLVDFAPADAPLPADPSTELTTPTGTAAPVTVTLEASTSSAVSSDAWQAAVAGLGWITDPAFDFRQGSPNVLVATGTLSGLPSPQARALLDQAASATAVTGTGGGN